ncbi:Uncharacterized protein OBRU01_26231, partial [Operophtera brumata]
SSKLKGVGQVSQRDLALTMFGFIGFSMLKPDAFGIRQSNERDWEGYNHFWRRVFTPCLENVPEYFEHSARVMLDGLWSINPTIDVDANLWWCRYLADVPGPAVAGLPDLSPRKLYYKDYNSVESSPEYKQLNFKSKTKLYLNYLYVSLYTCCLGRWYFNVNFKFSLFLMRYFPYVAFFRFGIKSSIVNVFVEDVKDDTKVKPNSDYKKHEETP